MIGDKKSIYHSTLVKFGPAYVTIKSDVLRSKKGDGHYIVVEHEGEDQFLNIENDACADVLRHKKGQSLTLEATGSRDDAEIKIAGPTGSSEDKPKSAAPDRRKALTKMMNIYHIIEQEVKKQTEQGEVDGIPFDAQNFGGKCSQTFRELYPMGVFDDVPDDAPIWSA